MRQPGGEHPAVWVVLRLVLRDGSLFDFEQELVGRADRGDDLGFQVGSLIEVAQERCFELEQRRSQDS